MVQRCFDMIQSDSTHFFERLFSWVELHLTIRYDTMGMRGATVENPSMTLDKKVSQPSQESRHIRDEEVRMPFSKFVESTMEAKSILRHRMMVKRRRTEVRCLAAPRFRSPPDSTRNILWAGRLHLTSQMEHGKQPLRQRVSSMFWFGHSGGGVEDQPISACSAIFISSSIFARPMNTLANSDEASRHGVSNGRILDL
jgi:hypothetical protein